MRERCVAIFLLAGVVLGGGIASAQVPDETACPAPEARQFDFWLGDWTIEQRILRADGSYAEFPARTTVRLAAAGCALVEDWSGTVQFFWEGMDEPTELHGVSVRAWDAERRTWRIHWLDDRNPAFAEPFAGGFEDDRGVFLRRAPGSDGVERTSRITFERPADGVVDWSLASTSDGGESWTTVWTMHMIRK